MNKYITKKELVERWGCHYTLPDYYAKTRQLRRKKVKNKVSFLMEDVTNLEATWSKSPKQQQQTVLTKIITWLQNLKIRLKESIR